MKKFNYVDVLIIVAVIAVCLVAGMYFVNLAGGGEKLTGEDSITYQLRIRETREDVAEEIQRNKGKLFNSDKDLYIGDIKDVEVKPCTLYSTNEIDGEYILTEVPERYDVYITVDAKGSYKDGQGAVINSIELYAGKTCNIKGINFAATSTVMSLEKID